MNTKLVFSLLVIAAAYFILQKVTLPSIGTPHYEVTISPTATEIDQIRDLVIKIQPPIFPTLQDKSNIKVKQFHNATSNRVFKCSYGDRAVMVRIHGEGSSKLVDRAKEIQFARELGTKLNASIPIYATFENGFIAKYLEGESITLEQMSGVLSRGIAETLATWHRIKESSPPTKAGESRGIWKTLDEWIEVAKEVVPAAELAPTLKEIEYTRKKIRAQHNVDTQPLVLCHNDLNFANILYFENPKNIKESEVFFLDYEYAGWNYPAFDLGNHFCEYGGMGSMDFSKYPTEETRRKFLQNYLKIVNPVKSVNQTQVDELLIEVEHYAQVSNLAWHLWALVISQTSQHTEGFDYKDYAKIRMDEYLRKKQLLNF